MNRITWLSVLSAALLFSCTTTGDKAAKKSSAIPDRREFPVNPEINACENFYEYACSEVVNSFQLREDRSSHTFAFNDSAERLLLAKQKYLQGLATKKKLSKRSRELSDVFKACTNEAARSTEERLLVGLTKEALAKIKDRAAFQNLVAKNIESASVSFVGFGTIPNHDNPDWYDIYLLSGVRSLPEHSYYENADLMTDFRKLLVGFFNTIGVDQAEKRADFVIQFEKGAIKTYPKPAEIREIISNKTGVKREDFIKKYPALRLDAFLRKLPKVTHLRDLTPDNYAYLNKSLEKLDLEALKSVYLYHELADDMDDAYPEFFKQRFEFRKKYLGGPNQRPEREERCTRMIMGRFDKEIDAELIDTVFPEFPADKVKSLAEKVRRSIVKGINENTWLTEAGKNNAARKIRTASLMVVKPRNNVEWDFNPELDYDPLTPIANLRRLDVKLSEKSLSDLKTTRNRNLWSMGPLTVNAYYSPSNNQFVLPVGILQYPFYDPKLSDIANLGAVGAVVGHELGHAIDDRGSRYDEKGRLIPILSDKDLEEFKKRTTGFVSQFTAAGFNGELTLGENIGDHVGLSFAYETAFPNNEGTVESKREFFLEYARVWCNVSRPSFRELQIKTDPHPLGYARVNEQVKHQAGFAEAFSCKEGDPMVLPSNKRIRVW